MKAAVLLLAHGAPERLEDVETYLGFVRSGRPLPPHVIEEIKQRYAEIGGGSPLLCWTLAQATQLEKLTGLKVYVGMRNWHPFIKDTMAQIKADGVERLIAICMAPQYSDMSVGFYIKRTEEARAELDVPVDIVWTKTFHRHPKLIEAFAEKLAPFAQQGQMLFTAHSLPEKVLQTGDPYDTETKATAAAVAQRLGIQNYDFAYQSQGMTQEKWLGPTVEETLDRYAAAGVKTVVLDPIGFVCDHVEVLYDVDILFKNYAASRGIELVRPESLNDSPVLTEALASIVIASL